MDVPGTYKTWGDVPECIRAAVEAYDKARRAGTSEPPMSERNKLTMAPLIEAAILAFHGGTWDFYR